MWICIGIIALLVLEYIALLKPVSVLYGMKWQWDEQYNNTVEAPSRYQTIGLYNAIQFAIQCHQMDQKTKIYFD